jgi:transposase
MSNFRRSWSPVGARAVLPQQQAYANEYLFSALNPISGESFHLILPAITADITHLFLTELKKQHPRQEVVIVWDNAPCHRRKDMREIDGLTIVSLPPNSPELNPAERFFEEIRRATANRIFDNLDAQANQVTKAVNDWSGDAKRLRKLIGYDWILKQLSEVS